MSEQIVVAFRSLEPGRPADEYLEAIRALSQQTAAMGGRLLTYSASVCTFEFDSESAVDAVELAISVALDSVPGMTFGVGMSEGSLARSSDATIGAPLAWGPALVRAVAFSRGAKHGEVLVDPELSAVQSGELLSQGARSMLHGKERLRAQLLDIRHPFRSALAGSIASLDKPGFVGRSELGELLISAGHIGVVRAEPGVGGSRFLAELALALEPARILTLTPHPLGEPLGALRRAMLRAVTLGHAPLAFGEQVGHALDSLLAGEGLDVDRAAELLSTWLTPDSAHDPSGVLLIDDADSVDSDTLDTVLSAAKITDEPFRVVVRLGRSDPVPTPLRGLPVATEVGLGPLQDADAAALVASCVRGQIDERVAELWSERGGGMPLGVVEAMYEALESGALVWEDDAVTARLTRTATRERLAPKRWVERRLRALEAEPRLLATALSIFGGEAETRDLHELIEHRTDASFDLNAARAVLEAAGWAVKIKPDMLGMVSATHRGVVLGMLDEDDFAAWHQAACEVLRRRARPLAIASRAVHAALAGDLPLASDLAGRAASVVRAAGLEEAARAFSSLAEEESLDLLVERRLLLPHMVLAQELPSLAPSKTVMVTAPDPPPPEDDVWQVDAEDLPPDSVVLIESEAPPSSRVSPTPSSPDRKDRDAPIEGDRAAHLPPVRAAVSGGARPGMGAVEQAPSEQDAATTQRRVASSKAGGSEEQSSSPDDLDADDVEERISTLDGDEAEERISASDEERISALDEADVEERVSDAEPDEERISALDEADVEERISDVEDAEERISDVEDAEERISDVEDAEERISTLDLDEVTDISDDDSAPVVEERPTMEFRRRGPEKTSSGSGAVAALRTGDLEAVEEIAARLRIDASRTSLADRLTAMASLARGETADALRRLRSAAKAAAEQGSDDQCRAQLALAIGLARAERRDEALLAVLSGLAKAREGQDRRGEQACIRFIAHLSETAGGPDSARPWKALIR